MTNSTDTKTLGYFFFQWAQRRLDTNFLMTLVGVLTGLAINAYTAFGHNCWFYLSVAGFVTDLVCLVALIRIQTAVKEDFETLLEEKLTAAEKRLTQVPPQPAEPLAVMIAGARKGSLTMKPGRQKTFSWYTIGLLAAFIGAVACLQIGSERNADSSNLDSDTNRRELGLIMAKCNDNTQLLKILRDSVARVDSTLAVWQTQRQVAAPKARRRVK